jgi:thymidylate synthase
MMLAKVTGYEAYEYIHTISDAHLYVDQVPMVKELLERETQPFPTVTLTKETDDIFAFRAEDFELTDYHAGEPMRNIPVAV